MKNTIILTLASLSFLLISCNKSSQMDLKNLDTIHVDVNSNRSPKQAHYGDLFSSTKVIALETKPESLIGEITRISVFEGKIYILDRETSTVFVFSNSGKFIHKFKYLGKGSGEYIHLVDFTIDERGRRILLYADRPNKIIFYSLDGKFLNEKPIDRNFDEISYSNGSLVFQNNDEKNKYLLYSRNLSTGDETTSLEIDEPGKFFQDFKLETPYLIKSAHTYLTLPYSNVIYKYVNGVALPGYLIDFGKANFPIQDLKKFNSPIDVCRYAIKNNYGFAISNFRESKNYISFTYGTGIMVFYSKKSKKVTTFFDLMIPSLNMPIMSHFAHNGNDDKIITVTDMKSFISGVDFLKSHEQMWRILPGYIKDIRRSAAANDNPLLLISELKAN